MLNEQEPTVQRPVKVMGRPKKQLDSEQRARREVANSNERRRMQCINNGFNCLRLIMKNQINSEKQSKAALLHASAQYILKLENDIKSIIDQNQVLINYADNHKVLKRVDGQGINDRMDSADGDDEDSADYMPHIKKLKLCDDMKDRNLVSMTESTGSNDSVATSDGIGSEEITKVLEKEVSELRALLSRERILRHSLEVRQRGITGKYDTSAAPNDNSVNFIGHYNHPKQSPESTVIPVQTSCYSSVSSDEKPLNLQKSKHNSNSMTTEVYSHNNQHLGQHLAYHFSHPYQMARHFTHWNNSNNIRLNEYNLMHKMFAQNRFPLSIPFPETKDQMPFNTTSSFKHTESSAKNTVNTSTTGAVGFRQNLDVILRAISFIEGQEGVKATGASDYVKRLTENLDFNANSFAHNLYLRQLLSNECRVKKVDNFGSNSKSGQLSHTRPSAHSVDSLL